MWRFKTLSVGDPERDPHEAELFNLTCLLKLTFFNQLPAVFLSSYFIG